MSKQTQRRGGVLAVLAAGLLLPACRGASQPPLPGSAPATSISAPSPSPSLSPSPTTSPTSEPLPTLDVPAERLLIAGSKPVTFPAGDGVRLAGRVFGPGSGRGVVLSHMGPEGFDQSAWWWMASLLADRGYSVLAFNFRGNCPGGIYGCSRGEANALDTVSDLRGAVAFLRSRGVESLVLGGASIGAMASLTEAGGGVPGLRGVVSLSGVELGGGFDIGPGVIRRIDVPTLFIAGRFDSEAAYAARRWGRAAAEPTETVIMETSAHGTDLFEDPRSSGHTRRLILEFAARYL